MLAQTPTDAYQVMVKKADHLYRIKNYNASGLAYTLAFSKHTNSVTDNDRFNAACSWARAGSMDSAFAQLSVMIKRGEYINSNQIKNEPDLNVLHKDKRWEVLQEGLKRNIDSKEAKFNKPLMRLLDSVLLDDQTLRRQVKATEELYGAQSKELEQLWETIERKDSINCVKVSRIIDTYGWLGKDIIGVKGNATLFLVIQHADLKTQEKYLPLMKEAVKKGNAEGHNLALLEDRILMSHDKKQVYGSQVVKNSKTRKWELYPVEDIDHVNERRANVNLEPLEEYLVNFGIEWIPKRIEAVVSVKSMYQDFTTAMAIQDSIVTVKTISMGIGQELDYNRNLYYKEQNVTWFKFKVYKDTILTFDIVPNNTKEDYDFALFKCNGTKCRQEIKDDINKPERLCFSVNEERFGATGLSLYGNKRYIGPGYGMGYASAIQIKAGEEYYLMINYAPGSFRTGKPPQGYTIYFYNYWPHKPVYLKKPDPTNNNVIFENVLFYNNTVKLTAESKKPLETLAKILKERPLMKVEIVGHTDNTGMVTKNQQLSEERAKVVVEYLVSQGIAESRFTHKGLGSTKPIATNDTEEGRLKNRRVEFKIKSK